MVSSHPGGCVPRLLPPVILQHTLLVLTSRLLQLLLQGGLSPLFLCPPTASSLATWSSTLHPQQCRRPRSLHPSRGVWRWPYALLSPSAPFLLGRCWHSLGTRAVPTVSCHLQHQYVALDKAVDDKFIPRGDERTQRDRSPLVYTDRSGPALSTVLCVSRLRKIHFC